MYGTSVGVYGKKEQVDDYFDFRKRLQKGGAFEGWWLFCDLTSQACWSWAPDIPSHIFSDELLQKLALDIEADMPAELVAHRAWRMGGLREIFLAAIHKRLGTSPIDKPFGLREPKQEN